MHCEAGTNALAESCPSACALASRAAATQIRTIRNSMILRAFSAVGASLYCGASFTQCGEDVRSSHVAIALAAVNLGAAAFAQTTEPRAVYSAACAACHGDDGRGRSSSELGFQVPLPDFTNCDFAV